MCVVFVKLTSSGVGPSSPIQTCTHVGGGTHGHIMTPTRGGTHGRIIIYIATGEIGTTAKVSIFKRCNDIVILHHRHVGHPSLMVRGENVRGGGSRWTVHGGRHLVTTSPPHS